MSDETTEAFFEEARKTYERALDACYKAAPEWHGKMLAPKRCGPFHNHIPMSFSRTLIHAAGGMSNLREHWYVET